MRASTAELIGEAKKLSVKRYASLEELRRRGHPYAKRHFKGRFRGGLPAPPFVINNQGGDLNRSWRSRVVVIAGNAVGTVYNIALHARYMMGTKKMIARPILTEAMRRVRSRLVKRFRGAVSSANRTR
jgi:hypothetical protein